MRSHAASSFFHGPCLLYIFAVKRETFFVSWPLPCYHFAFSMEKSYCGVPMLLKLIKLDFFLWFASRGSESSIKIVLSHFYYIYSSDIIVMIASHDVAYVRLYEPNVNTRNFVYVMNDLCNNRW